MYICLSLCMSIHDVHDVRRNRSCDARRARLEFRDVHDVRFYWCPWCDDGSCATTTSATTPSGRSTTLTLDGLRGTSTSTVAPSGGSTSAIMATPRGLLFGVNAEGTCTSTTTGLDLRAARCSPPSTRRRGRGQRHTTTFQFRHPRGQ